MNPSSFRLKIALWSGGLTGILLIASGVALWEVSYRFNLNRLDREIRNLGQANLDRVVGGDHWERLDAALKFVGGEQASTRYVLWAKTYDRVVYQSPAWPKEIAPGSLAVPERYDVPGGVLAPGPLPPPPRRAEQISPRNPALPRRVARFHTIAANGTTWRIGVMGNPYVTLVVAADIDEFNSRMRELRNLFAGALPIVLLLAAGGAWIVAGRALRPVTTLTATAEHVTAQGLDRRIPVMRHDPEFNRLITVFNEMLDRLEKSFRQATRFSADASHELKTPLTRLQMELEQALQSASTESREQQVYGSLLEEVHRLKAIVEKLLLLSQADAGRLRLQQVPVDLSAILRDVVEDCEAQAAAVTVKADIAPDVSVNGDGDLLEQAMQNLGSNAVKYTPAGGAVRIALRRDAADATITFENSGPQIPAADRDRLFERFYRGDPSRSGRTGGTGLGLSLARELIRAHGGEVSFDAEDPAVNRFIVRLPISSATGLPSRPARVG